MHRFRTQFFLIALFTLFIAPFIATGSAYAQTDSRYFPETGHTVQGSFLLYWQSHGGLAQQGYPLTEELQEASTPGGQSYATQYFERAVFELHPEFAGTDNEVLLARLGSFLYKSTYPSGAPNQTPSAAPGAQLFQQTGKALGGAFLSYWQSHGGLSQQGLPISDEFQELNAQDGKTYTVQYFERAVFELHPEFAGTANEVLLSRVGRAQLNSRHPEMAPGGPGGGAQPTQPPAAAPPTSPPAAPPTNTPQPVATNTPVPAPTNTPQPTGNYVATASVSNSSPTQNSHVTVTGKLTRGGQGVPGVTMNTSWYYKTTTSGCDAATNSSGVASCERSISRATKGYTVIISVLFIDGGGAILASTQTSFTPQ